MIISSTSKIFWSSPKEPLYSLRYDSPLYPSPSPWQPLIHFLTDEFTYSGYFKEIESSNMCLFMPGYTWHVFSIYPHCKLCKKYLLSVLKNIPSYGYNTFCLCIQQLMNFWAICELYYYEYSGTSFVWKLFSVLYGTRTSARLCPAAARLPFVVHRCSWRGVVWPPCLRRRKEG